MVKYCQYCNKKFSKKLSHSISAWEKVRFSVDNGVTLCRVCHAVVHQLPEYKLAQV